MKRISTISNAWSENKVLRVKSDRGEHFDYASMEWLKEEGGPNLLTLSSCSDPASNGPHVFAYDISGLTSLKAFLRRDLTGDEFLYLLTDMVQAIERCDRGPLSSESLVFNPDCAYLDDAGTLKLPFVPVSNVRKRFENREFAFLSQLADSKNLRFAMPADTLFSEHLKAFILREDNVFNAIDLKGFIEDEFGVGFALDGGLYEIDKVESRFVLSETSDSHVGGYRGLGSRRGDTKGGENDAAGKFLSGAKLVRMRTDELFPLEEGVELSIGKGGASDIRIPGNDMISRVHARLIWKEGTGMLFDAGSTNGTYVEGIRIEHGESFELKQGDVFYLADEPFCVE